MKLNKPSIALAAILAGGPGCAGSQDAPKTPETRSAECDRKEMKNITVISTEPGRIVFKVCRTTYVAETREATKSAMEGTEKEADAPGKPDVGVKVCNPLDLSNMRIERVSKNKSIGRICDYIHTWESKPADYSVEATRKSLSVKTTRSTLGVSAERVPAAPVAPKTEDTE